MIRMITTIAASATNKKLKYVWENGILISAAEAAKKPGMQPDPAEEDPRDEDEDPSNDTGAEDPSDDTEDPSDDTEDHEGTEDPKKTADSKEDPKKTPDPEEDPKKAPASGDDPFKERNKGVTKKIIDKFRKLAMATGQRRIR